jgi:hypothetical protein
MFNDEQIQTVINLLHSKYHRMDLSVYILKNKWQSLLYYNLLGKEQIKYVFKKLTSGISLHKHNIIFIYPFNYKYDYTYINKLNTIMTIYHEIRHQYQKRYLPIKYSKYNLCPKYGLNSDMYYKQWEEKDADGFSKQTILNNYKIISNIVDYYHWKIKV